MRVREGISVGTELDGRALPVSPRYQQKGLRELPLGPFCFPLQRPSISSASIRTI